MSDLFCAVIDGDLEMVKLLLSRGADINETNLFGCTALINAAQNHRSDKEITEFLLDRGADINAGNQYEQTLLHMAAIRGDKEMAEFLLDKGADIEMKDNEKFTPLRTAVYYSKIEMVKLLMDRGADINTKDKDGETPQQVCLDYYEIYQLLEENRSTRERSNKVLSQDVLDLLLGHLTCAQNCSYPGIGESDLALKSAKALLSLGANPNKEYINDYNDKFYTLHEALENDFMHLAELLLKYGADVNIKDQCRGSLLHNFAYHGDKVKVEFLLRHGADINAKGIVGDTVLQSAVLGDSKEVVELLLDRGADVNTKDHNGSMPLHKAASFGYIEILKLLIDRGSDINVKDVDGRTPAYYGIHDPEILKLLKKEKQ